ncbi:MAG: hypothetical protein QF752_00310 [Planctomycetota bacterium]|nr:hypothetical protein [Planctomycetota bacterium]
MTETATGVEASAPVASSDGHEIRFNFSCPCCGAEFIIQQVVPTSASPVDAASVADEDVDSSAPEPSSPGMAEESLDEGEALEAESLDEEEALEAESLDEEEALEAESLDEEEALEAESLDEEEALEAESLDEEEALEAESLDEEEVLEAESLDEEEVLEAESLDDGDLDSDPSIEVGDLENMAVETEVSFEEDLDGIRMESAVEDVEEFDSGILSDVSEDSDIELDSVIDVGEMDEDDEDLTSFDGIEEILGDDSSDVLGEISEVEDLGDISEVEDLGDISEVVDLGEISEVEDLDEISEVEDLDEISEVEDLDDISDIMDLGDISEVEDLGDISEVEDLGDISDVVDLESDEDLDFDDLEGTSDAVDVSKDLDISDTDTSWDEDAITEDNFDLSDSAEIESVEPLSIEHSDELEPWTGRARDYKPKIPKDAKKSRKKKGRKKKESSDYQEKGELSDEIIAVDDENLVDSDPAPVAVDSDLDLPEKEDGAYSLFLQKIQDEDVRKQVVGLLVVVKGIDEDDAEDLSERMIVPVLKGVSRKYGEEILALFKKKGANGRVTKKR